MACEDSLIAATALHHAHTIVTRNLFHFKPAGVPAFDPTA
jgi:predicted nucleic acid-binding protein